VYEHSPSTTPKLRAIIKRAYKNYIRLPSSKIGNSVTCDNSNPGESPRDMNYRSLNTIETRFVIFVSSFASFKNRRPFRLNDVTERARYSRLDLTFVKYTRSSTRQMRTTGIYPRCLSPVCRRFPEKRRRWYSTVIRDGVVLGAPANWRTATDVYRSRVLPGKSASRFSDGRTFRNTLCCRPNRPYVLWKWTNFETENDDIIVGSDGRLVNARNPIKFSTG